MLSSAILPLKLRIIWSVSFSDVTNFCVIYVYNDCPQMNQIHQSHHLRTGLTSHLFYAYDIFFFFLLYFFLGAESDDDDESDESDGDGSGSEFTFGPCFSHFDVQLCSDRFISIRVGISSIFSRSSIFSIFCSSIRVILNRVSISLIFSRLIFSRSNILLVSKSKSFTYLRNANFSLIFWSTHESPSFQWC